jgi:hypothetical protein
VSMWHAFFGYVSFSSLSLCFFDMLEHVAYILWVDIFYFFLHSPHS